MGNNDFRLTEEEFANFAEKYLNVKGGDVEELVVRKLLTEKAYRAQRSEFSIQCFHPM